MIIITFCLPQWRVCSVCIKKLHLKLSEDLFSRQWLGIEWELWVSFLIQVSIHCHAESVKRPCVTPDPSPFTRRVKHGMQYHTQSLTAWSNRTFSVSVHTAWPIVEPLTPGLAGFFLCSLICVCREGICVCAKHPRQQQTINFCPLTKMFGENILWTVYRYVLCTVSLWRYIFLLKHLIMIFYKCDDISCRFSYLYLQHVWIWSKYGNLCTYIISV